VDRRKLGGREGKHLGEISGGGEWTLCGTITSSLWTTQTADWLTVRSKVLFCLFLPPKFPLPSSIPKSEGSRPAQFSPFNPFFPGHQTSPPPPSPFNCPFSSFKPTFAPPHF
jgi:hypothetical protein